MGDCRRGNSKNGRELNVRVDGQLNLNNIFKIRDAALDGLGLAYIPEDIARPFLFKGTTAAVARISHVLSEPPPCLTRFCPLG